LAAEALRAGKLVQVLEAYAPMLPGVFLCYPGRRQIMPKLRAFIDHVKSRRAGDSTARVEDDARRARPRSRKSG
jgi:DNA-binding transcriptional LysR family regulator